MGARIVCTTVSSTDLADFDLQVSEMLNDEKWDRFYYQVTFIQDEHTFYAHIIFTENTSLVDLKAS